VIVIAIFLSALIRYEFAIPDKVFNLMGSLNIYIVVSVKLIVFQYFRLYRSMWRYTSVWDLVNILKVNLAATVILYLLVYISTKFYGISRSLFLIDYMICTGLICLSRLSIRVFLMQLTDLNYLNQFPPYRKNVILIGAGDTGYAIAHQILHGKRNKNLLSIVKIFDDDKKKQRQTLHGIKIDGPISKLSLLDLDYDDIYICIPSATGDQIKAIVNICEKTGRPFKTLPSFTSIIKGEVSLSQFRDVSLIDLLGRKEIILDKSSISNFIRAKRVLVTGAGGSIGSELVRQCINYEPSVLIMLDASELNLFKIDREINSSGSKIQSKSILGDIREHTFMDRIFNEFRPQVVFHAAAYKHVPIQEDNPWEAIKTNIFGTSILSKVSLKHEVEKFVLVSTDKAVMPVNVMGATKRIAELTTQYFNHKNSKTDFMAVRFGNVLGSSGSVIPIFKEQIKKGGPITITDPEMERYFMSIPEASQLILQAGALGGGGEIFILDMGRPIKIIDIANALVKLSGYKASDIPIEITGIRPGEKKTEELSLPNENLDKTKHKKIFVLKKYEFRYDEIEKIIENSKKLESNLAKKSAADVKISLSEILNEYKPNDDKNNYKFINLDAKT
ncbi:polysaccharide biosynthesis protein, partial [Candidatus Marinimicrobia bacterium]|nr:polysaccharide biosynthesis protein [Candidatus Neomarinimicrobiota bacterium]